MKVKVIKRFYDKTDNLTLRDVNKEIEVSIVSDTPYARRLYFHPECNFNRDENIAAGGELLTPW